MKTTLKRLQEFEIFRLRKEGNIYMILGFNKDAIRIYNFRSKEAKSVPFDTECFPIYNP